ncbi:hypothetical protein TSOC_002374 [Tetrabaena socialis]|uniref:Uncharacterized protein n=1 Tax=Tetrabaena socialis TaxID=47790 RepID=A0A2J8AEE8_9CHLO|nr:hypothetical protein TSOC_002374 [Tetrabaena socialis]|eukprot:PNH10882.1 hypothetical protein TSOC_002374 [Tetrabaena socialis]
MCFYTKAMTAFDSWPRPNTVECKDNAGCEWAGMFKDVGPVQSSPCPSPSLRLDGGNGIMACRYPPEVVKRWNMAATYNMDASLLGRKLEVMVQGGQRVVTVNVKDVCSDLDCDGCCKANSGNKAWKLIDLEKGPASQLLGFDTSSPRFDINDVPYPGHGGKRQGANPGAMALCYRDVGVATWVPGGLASSTAYDSWPKPNTMECKFYEGCKYAGQFSELGPEEVSPCIPPSVRLDGGDGTKACRFPEPVVRSWNMAATYDKDASLKGRKLEVMVQGGQRVVTVNVKDVCSDLNCEGCCKANSGNKAWKLIDLEKWPASALLGFETSSRTFDINDVQYPGHAGKRQGAAAGAMALCYRDVGVATLP